MSSEMKLFMRLFPPQSVMVIDSEEAFDEWVLQIIEKYDGQEKDKTFLFAKLVRTSFQKPGERIETYVERMMEYFLKWKQIKHVDEGSEESITLTNAICHKLNHPVIKTKLFTDHVGLIQKGKLKDIVRFVNDFHQGKQYVKQQAQIYNPEMKNQNRKMKRHSGSRRYVYAIDKQENIRHNPRKNEFQYPESSEDERRLQLNGDSSDYECGPVQSQDSDNDVEGGIYYVEHDRKGTRRHYRRKGSKGRNQSHRPTGRNGFRDSKEDDRDDKLDRDDERRVRFNSFTGKGRERQMFRRSARRIAPKEFTRRKSHAKRILGFRRILQNKNIDRKTGTLRNKVPEWYKGPPRNFVPKEEYLQLRKKHLTSKPLKVAKREKNQHNIVVDNINIEKHYIAPIPAWAEEMTSINLISHSEGADINGFLEKYDIFEVNLPEERIFNISERRNTAGDLYDYYDYDEDDSDDYYDHADEEYLDDGEEDEEFVGSIDINEIDKDSYMPGRALSTFYCDIFVDFNRHFRPTNLERAIEDDCMRQNNGDMRDSKFCSIATLVDSGAAVSIYLYAASGALFHISKLSHLTDRSRYKTFVLY